MFQEKVVEVVVVEEAVDHPVPEMLEDLTRVATPTVAVTAVHHMVAHPLVAHPLVVHPLVVPQLVAMVILRLVHPTPHLLNGGERSELLLTMIFFFIPLFFFFSNLLQSIISFFLEITKERASFFSQSYRNVSITIRVE